MIDRLRHHVRRMARSAYATSAGTTFLFSFVSALAGVVASRALGPYERGLLATAVAWSAVVGTLATYGTPLTATYFVSRDEDDPPRAATTVMAIGGVAALVVSAVGVAVSLSFVTSEAATPVAVAFAGLILSIPAGAALGAVAGLGEYRAWGLLRLLAPALTLMGTVFVIVLGWNTATAITVVTVIANVLQFGVLLRSLRRRNLLHEPAKRLVRPIVDYSWRNVVSGAGWVLNYRLDQLILSFAVNPRLLGLYAVSASFSALIVPIAGSVGTVILKRVASGGEQALRQTLPRAIAACLLLSGGFGVVVIAGAPLFVELIYGEAFLGAVTALRILLVGTVFLTVSSLLADALRGLGKPLAPARAEVVGVATTAVLLPLLLPALGIEGAAIASAVSYTVSMAFMALSLRREMRSARGEDAASMGGP